MGCKVSLALTWGARFPVVEGSPALAMPCIWGGRFPGARDALHMGGRFPGPVQASRECASKQRVAVACRVGDPSGIISGSSKKTAADYDSETTAMTEQQMPADNSRCQRQQHRQQQTTTPTPSSSNHK
mmetsp:Transcript_21091/g.49336  ORF Transcript_21091/g.49336 Transcript_21091/m.49336 type:complete len:128 (+) Transcript_21091:3630-4013(+)